MAPKGVIQPEELPEGWGLAVPVGGRVRRIVMPPKLERYETNIMRNEIGLLFAALRKVELGLPLDRLHEDRSLPAG